MGERGGAGDRGIQEFEFTLRLNPEDEQAREAMNRARLRCKIFAAINR